MAKETFVFYVSTGLSGCSREEEIEIEFEGNESEEERVEIIETEFNAWLQNSCDLGYWKKGD